jgi:hypothetical protein
VPPSKQYQRVTLEPLVPRVVLLLFAFWALPIVLVASLLVEVGLGGTSLSLIAAVYLWSFVLLVALLPAHPHRLVQPLAAGILAASLLG